MPEKQEIVQQAVEKFMHLDVADKSFVLGYITGKQEERAQRATEARQEISDAKKRPNGNGSGGAA